MGGIEIGAGRLVRRQQLRLDLGRGRRQERAPGQSVKRLVITGGVIMGGVEIKN
jgi:hypothetical protein